MNETMRTTGIGLFGTATTWFFKNYNEFISATVGTLTAIYIGCKIYDWISSKRQGKPASPDKD